MNFEIFHVFCFFYIFYDNLNIVGNGSLIIALHVCIIGTTTSQVIATVSVILVVILSLVFRISLP